MKSVSFPEQNLVIAKDQPQYNPLPAHVANGVVTSCWEPDAEDIKRLALYGKLYVSQCTFGKALQPLTVQTEFNPPVLPQPAREDYPVESSTKPTPSTPVETLSTLRGVGKRLVFAMDGESVPGKTIVHFVRFDSQAFDDQEGVPSTLDQIAPGVDARLDFLANIFRQADGGGQAANAQSALVQLLKILGICAGNLQAALLTGKLPPPVAKSVELALKLATKATDTQHG